MLRQSLRAAGLTSQINQRVVGMQHEQLEEGVQDEWKIADVLLNRLLKSEAFTSQYRKLVNFCTVCCEKSDAQLETQHVTYIKSCLSLIDYFL